MGIYSCVERLTEPLSRPSKLMEKKSRRKSVPSQGTEAETAEILSDKELIQDIRDAGEDVRRGRVIPYEKFKKKHMLPQTQ